jgi:putative transcriptional regulator
MAPDQCGKVRLVTFFQESDQQLSVGRFRWRCLTDEAANISQHRGQCSRHDFPIPNIETNIVPPGARSVTVFSLSATWFCVIMTSLLIDANRVKEARQMRGWSQGQLADKADISRIAVNAIEIQRLVPSVAAAMAPAKAFGSLFPLPGYDIRRKRSNLRLVDRTPMTFLVNLPR